jgi:acetoin utilization deacetylase AcuC-like enzyme
MLFKAKIIIASSNNCNRKINLKIFYTDTFPIPLPEKHTFPKNKYLLLRNRIQECLGAQKIDLQIPEPASYEAIRRAHDEAYIRRFYRGDFTSREIRRVGLPWSLQIVKRTLYSVGGTIAACKTALLEGFAANLGGGTHHAFYESGQGYCWLNDSVIAAREVQAERLAKRILIVDCDVHQGNGTASIAKNDPTIFTFSIHCRNNFPYRKEPSDLDIELLDETDDASYLGVLKNGLTESIQKSKADLAIYLAGADPYKKDRFGRLSLTKAGLAQRDHLVLKHLKKAAIPVAVTMAGGYAPNIQDIVDIHYQTIHTLIEFKKEVKRKYDQ